MILDVLLDILISAWTSIVMGKLSSSILSTETRVSVTKKKTSGIFYWDENKKHGKRNIYFSSLTISGCERCAPRPSQCAYGIRCGGLCYNSWYWCFVQRWLWCYGAAIDAEKHWEETVNVISWTFREISSDASRSPLILGSESWVRWTAADKISPHFSS